MQVSFLDLPTELQRTVLFLVDPCIYYRVCKAWQSIAFSELVTLRWLEIKAEEWGIDYLLNKSASMKACERMTFICSEFFERGHQKKQVTSFNFVYARSVANHENQRNITIIIPTTSKPILSKITHLNKSQSDLTIIPKELPLTFSNLTELDFGGNSICSISRLKELKQLKVLNLSSNSIEEWPEGLGSSWNLETFNIFNNKIKTLPASFGASWHAMTRCFIGNNQISTLPANFGSNWKNLTTLDVASNPLTIEDTDFGIAWTKLMFIYPGNNQELRQQLNTHKWKWQKLSNL